MIKAYILSLAAVFLWAATALISDITLLSALLIVFGRTLFATPILLLCVRLKPFLKKLTKATLKTQLKIGSTGILLALHWLCFFGAIEKGSVAIGLLTFACTPLFILLINLVAGVQSHWRADLATCAMILLGISIAVPLNSNTDFLPWALGFLSAFLISLFAFFNKTLLKTFDPLEMAMTQNLVCFLVVAPLVSPQAVQAISLEQWGYLVACGVLCTALAQFLFLKSMQTLSALQASFIVNLEPVFGLMLALLVLGEQLPWSQWLGGGIIISSVMFSTIKDQLLALVERKRTQEPIA